MVEQGKPPAARANPCLSCGACCAYFRVVFYWREAEPGMQPSTHVPLELTVDVDPFRRCMRGTTEKSGNRCAALAGRVGERAWCTIYEGRPSPCREFTASYSDGKQNKRCDEARAAHGLRPLRPEDWNRAS